MYDDDDANEWLQMRRREFLDFSIPSVLDCNIKKEKGRIFNFLLM